eukprot:10125934-Prorocentrum_lima.AAC.1
MCIRDRDKLEQIRIQTRTVAQGTNIPIFVYPRSTDILWLLDKTPFDAMWAFYDIPRSLTDIVDDCRMSMDAADV